MTSTRDDLKPDVSRCPKCGYADKAGALAMKGECPACGIVVAKYLQRVRASENPKAEKTPEPAKEASEEKNRFAHFPSASTKRRALASLYSFSAAFLLFMILLVLENFVAVLFLQPPQVIDRTTLSKLTQWKNYFEFFRGLGLFLIVLYIFLHVPIRKGQSWGQEKMGVSISSDPSAGRGMFLKRFVGNIVTLFLCPVLIPYQYFRGGDSLADRISGTRQVEIMPLPAKAKNTAVIPLLIALGLHFVINVPVKRWMADQWTQKKPVQASTSAQVKRVVESPQAILDNSLFQTLSSRQSEHRQKNGSYTDDVGALLVLIGKDFAEGPQGQRAQVLVRTGKLKIKITGTGFEMGFESSPGQWRIISHKGVEAPRTTF